MTPFPRFGLRFPLPDGAYWRDAEDKDISWLDQMHPEWRTHGVGILCVRYRLRDDREGSPTRGQERECVLDNAGGVVVFGDRTYRRAGIDMDPERVINGFRFQLTDGNMGCGCNRAIEFARAGGDPRPEDRPCDAKIVCTWPAWVADADGAS